MLVSFDVNDEDQSVVVLDLLHGRLCSQRELDDGIMVQPGNISTTDLRHAVRNLKLHCFTSLKDASVLKSVIT